MPVRKPKQPDTKAGKTRLQKDMEVLTSRKTKVLRKQNHIAGEDIKPFKHRAWKYDWEAAREMYMTAEPQMTLKQIALRMGIPYQQIRTRASKERWTAVRVREQMEIMKSRRQQSMHRMAGEAIVFDETSVDVAKMGQGIVAGRLIELAKILAANGDNVDYVVGKIRRGEPLRKGDLWSVIDHRELLSLAQAAQMFQAIGRTAFGTDVTDGVLGLGEDGTVEKVVSISDELSKDDPARLAQFVEVLERIGLTALDLGGEEQEDEPITRMVMEGEVVEQQPAIAATAHQATGPELNDAAGNSVKGTEAVGSQEAGSAHRLKERSNRR